MEAERGFTLIEVIVTLAIIGIVSGSLYLTYQTFINSWYYIDSTLGIQQDAQNLEQILKADISEAIIDRIELEQDLKIGDHTYVYQASDNILLRNNKEFLYSNVKDFKAELKGDQQGLLVLELILESRDGLNRFKTELKLHLTQLSQLRVGGLDE